MLVWARDVITNMLIFRLCQREYLTDLFRDGVTVVAKEGVPFFSDFYIGSSH